jgi:DNA-directed RNA polymerase specialized sigma24 family protein
MKSADETSGSIDAGPVQFPLTLWTIVLEANQAEPERAQEALGELCVHYRDAILGYFRLKCQHHQDAEDLAGAFIAHLLERKRLDSFKRSSCSRFRSYLSVALKNFFADWIEKRNAAKRGAGKPEESIEVLREAGIESSADDPQLKRAVDLGIARAIHQQAMSALAKKASDHRRFEILRNFIPYEHGAETYALAAKQLNLSPPAFRKAVFDLRKNYVQQFRAAVAPTVRNARGEVDDEARELLDLLPEAIALESCDGVQKTDANPPNELT